jgi:propanol-preferring alcohol dehydrogenase
VNSTATGTRVGVAWIFSACGACQFCQSGQENLCEAFTATGRDVDGGYAEYMVAPAEYVHPLPESMSDVDAAPLLCAGAIGYRSLRLAGLKPGQSLGLTGFGASAHLVMKMVRLSRPDILVYVFARDPKEQAFALDLGAVWAGGTTDHTAVALDAIIDTTPAWTPVVQALENLKPGGRLVINAIRKEGHDQDSLLNLNYPEHLWMEKEIKSVANVTRADVREFIELCSRHSLKPEIQVFPLNEANRALIELRRQTIRGAKVLVTNS